jgi:hypothetical protein
MNRTDKEYGILILPDALGARNRIQENVDSFLADWDLVLNKLELDANILERQLSDKGFKTGIKIKDIFDNIQIFYPTDDPHTKFVDMTGSNPLWWTI